MKKVHNKKYLFSLWQALSFFILLIFSPDYSFASEAREIYLKYRCIKCHSIKSENIEPLKEELLKGKKIIDHSGVGLKYDAEWLKKWLLKEVEKDGEKHRVKFKGSPQELDTLTRWLVEKKERINPEEIRKWYREIIGRQ